MRWFKYLLKQLISFLPVLLFISVVSFAIVQLTPGDPATILLQQRGAEPTSEAIAVVRAELALDKNAVERYFIWLQSALRGDLGYSYYSGEPVLQELLRALPISLELALSSIIVAGVGAFVLAVYSLRYRQSLLGKFCSAYAALAVSIPSYWLALLLIYLFAVKLQLLPAVGRGSLSNLLLPVICLAFAPLAVNMQLLLSSVRELWDSEYILFARAKGLSQWQVLVHHALKPALVPFITSLGTSFGYMLGGVAIIESIFAWPGLGSVIVQAIFNRDYPLIQGYILLMAIIYTLVNIIVDAICSRIDPRIKQRRSGYE